MHFRPASPRVFPVYPELRRIAIEREEFKLYSLPPSSCNGPRTSPWQTRHRGRPDITTITSPKMNRTTRYPRHLAKYVAARFLAGNGHCPPEAVLTTLFETLYFASLKTDEGRRCRFTLNYIDPGDAGLEASRDSTADRWTSVRFEQPLPFDIRTLTKLADAVDPSVASLAVFCDDNGRLFIWGLVDQELRYADYASLDLETIPSRPGLFQAKIKGVGNVSVYQDYSLIGSLEHDTLVAQYHDVIWDGPIHGMLETPLRATYHRLAEAESLAGPSHDVGVDSQFLPRSLNALCRILLNIQRYRHGGGLLISPDSSPRATNVKYRLHYDRLPKAVFALVRNHLISERLHRDVRNHCHDDGRTDLPRKLHDDLEAQYRQREAHRNEILGCARFVASLSRVDGFVVLDRSLVVHGFGAELRPNSKLREVWLARDSRAQQRLMRTAHLEEYGTRHRAMARYCFEMPDTLGFVVSQDGDIRAMARIGDRLVLWENVNVQLAFKVENQSPVLPFTSLTTDAPQSDVA